MTGNIPSGLPLNSKFKSTEHPEWTGEECLLYLMEKSKEYNSYCTVHTNLVDAYDNSDRFQYYVDNDLLCRNNDGSYIKGWYAPHGQAYNVSIASAWADPEGLKKQIDDLFEALPAIVETGVLYTDANVASI